MRLLLAIDPGPEHSGAVFLDPSAWPPTVVLACADWSTRDLGAALAGGAINLTPLFQRVASVCIEQVEARGMAVGQETLDTAWWAGRLHEAARYRVGEDCIHRIFRRDVKWQLCADSRAKDANIRQALLDLYPRTGAGKTPQVGRKGKPGPLYGVTSHAWSALAVGVAHLMREREKNG